MTARLFALILAAPAAAVAQPAVDAPKALATAGPAVVRVHSRGNAGVGVVFADRSHVLTARRLVMFGRPVRITFPDGTVMAGKTLDGDNGDAHAIVRLEREAAVEPIGVAEAPPAVGAPVAVISRAHTLSEGDQPAVALGRVVAAKGSRLHIDAPVPRGSAGSPVLDADGRVVGIVVDADGGWTEVVPSPVFAGLEPGGMDFEPGDWVATMASGGMLGVSTDRTMTKGLYSGFRVVGWDQLQLDARFGILFDDGLPVDDEIHLSREKVGMFLDAMAGYRFNLMPADVGPLQLTLSGGVTVQQHGGTLRSLDADSSIVKRQIDESWTRPAVGLSLRMLDLIDLNYTWDINTDDLGASSHRIGIGFGF